MQEYNTLCDRCLDAIKISYLDRTEIPHETRDVCRGCGNIVLYKFNSTAEEISQVRKYFLYDEED